MLRQTKAVLTQTHVRVQTRARTYNQDAQAIHTSAWHDLRRVTSSGQVIHARHRLKQSRQSSAHEGLMLFATLVTIRPRTDKVAGHATLFYCAPWYQINVQVPAISPPRRTVSSPVVTGNSSNTHSHQTWRHECSYRNASRSTTVSRYKSGSTSHGHATKPPLSNRSGLTI